MKKHWKLFLVFSSALAFNSSLILAIIELISAKTLTLAKIVFSKLAKKMLLKPREHTWTLNIFHLVKVQVDLQRLLLFNTAFKVVKLSYDLC